MQKLGVVHLEEHTGDLAGKFGLSSEDERVDSLTEHLLLLSGSGSAKSGSGELLRSRGGGTFLASGLLTLRTGTVLSRSTTGGTTVRSSSSGTSTGTRSHTANLLLLLLSSVTSRAHRTSVRHTSGRHRVRHGSGGSTHGLTVRTVSRSTTGGNHTGRRVAHHGTSSTVSSRRRRVVHGLLGHVSSGSTETGSGGHLHSLVVSRSDLVLESCSSGLLSLSDGDVEGLGADHLAVHLCDGLSGLIGGREANETETSGSTTLLVSHDLARGDRTESVELGSESLVIPVVSDVLDVQVDTLVLGLLLESGSLVRSSELLVTLVSLLGSRDKELLALVLGVVQSVNGLLGVLVSLKVDETEALGLAFLILGKCARHDRAERSNEGLKVLLGGFGVKVLDVDVGELSLELLNLGHSLLLGNVVTDVDLLVVEKHTVDSLDGGIGGLTGLVVNETVASGLTVLVSGDLAGQDITESSECVVEGLVVNRRVEVLDEDVSLGRLSERGVSLRPHDSAGSSLDEGVVEAVKSSLTIVGVEVVDVCVTKRSSSDGVSADSDALNRSDHVEDLEQHGLSDSGVKFTDVQGSRGRNRGSGSGGSVGSTTLGSSGGRGSASGRGGSSRSRRGLGLLGGGRGGNGRGRDGGSGGRRHF